MVEVPSKSPPVVRVAVVHDDDDEEIETSDDDKKEMETSDDDKEEIETPDDDKEEIKIRTPFASSEQEEKSKFSPPPQASISAEELSTLSAEALHQRGEQYCSVQQYNLAFICFSAAAESDYPPAQLRLGLLYQMGYGVPKDEIKAIECFQEVTKNLSWFTEQTTQGNPWAQFYLGCCYGDGVGVAQDSKQAFAFYKRAAEQGLAMAQYTLGNYYGHKEGVENFLEAVGYYHLAASQGHAGAQNNLGEYYRNQKHDHKQAFMWFKRAAEQGNPSAQSNLADCYYKGKGVEQSNLLAALWQAENCQQRANATPKGLEKTILDVLVRHLRRDLSASPDPARREWLSTMALSFVKTGHEGEWLSTMALFSAKTEHKNEKTLAESDQEEKKEAGPAEPLPNKLDSSTVKMRACTPSIGSPPLTYLFEPESPKRAARLKKQAASNVDGQAQPPEKYIPLPPQGPA